MSDEEEPLASPTSEPSTPTGPLHGQLPPISTPHVPNKRSPLVHEDSVNDKHSYENTSPAVSRDSPPVANFTAPALPPLAVKKTTLKKLSEGAVRKATLTSTKKGQVVPSELKETNEKEEETHVEVPDEIDQDLETYLHTDFKFGLTDSQVLERLEKFGMNELVEVKTSAIMKFLGYFGGAISILLEVAVVISAVTQDWPDFVILILVLVVNACIGYFEEAKAENALEALKNTLALKSKCWRNGIFAEVNATLLVPGDVIAIRLGDIVPADCRLLGVGVGGEESAEGELHIDQSGLSGESLPVRKRKDATAYASSIVKQGQMLCVVTKTGAKTYIGRAAHLISQTHDEGHFQKIINKIGNFLIVMSLVLYI